MNWGNKKRNFCKSCKAFTQTLRFASAVESHCFKSCYHIFIHQLFCFMFHQMWSKTRNVLKGFPFYFSQLKFKWRAASKSSARVCSTLKNAWKICNANNFQAAFLSCVFLSKCTFWSWILYLPQVFLFLRERVRNRNVLRLSVAGGELVKVLNIPTSCNT